MPESNTNNVALLIDWENIKCSTINSLRTPPDVITLKKIARRYGTLRIGRAYANWTDPSGWHAGDVERLVALGIEPVFVPTRHFDNAGDPYEKDLVDLRLACDGMELLATRPEIGCFVVVSGDGALETLLSKLSAAGKQIVRVAVEASLSRGTRVLGEERVVYDNWIKGFLLQQNAEVDQAITAFTKAVDELAANKADCGLDAVKIQMRRQDPNFEEESLGIPTFRHLACLAEARGSVCIDASLEPARAYPENGAQQLPSGNDWVQFIKCLDGGTDYTEQGLEASCEEAHFDRAKVNPMTHAALKSDVLVRISGKYVDRHYQTRQAKDFYAKKLRLNTHHPRVQIAFATTPAHGGRGAPPV